MRYSKGATPTNMMTPDQVEIVKLVYARFMESEEEIWTELDENLEFFSYLTPEELISEAKIKYQIHSRDGIRCAQEHDVEFCFGPKVLEAVAAIISLYDDTKDLHVRNEYIISYYLVMVELRMLFAINGASSAL